MKINGKGKQLTADQEAAMDANTALNASNPVADMASIPTVYVVKPANQSAATFTSTSSAKSKIFLDYFPIVTFEAGNCTIDISNLYSKTTLQGDTRPLAGHHWAHGIAVRSTKTGAGVGTVSLTVSTNELTIACSTTNPDFTGWTTDDRVLIMSAAKAMSIHDITNISGHVLTLDPAPPVMNNKPCFVALIPNRTINAAVYLSKGQHIVFQGFFFDSITTDDSINAEARDCDVELENCLIYNTIAGVMATKSTIKANAETTIADCDYCIYAADNSHVDIDGVGLFLGNFYGLLASSNVSVYGNYVRGEACRYAICFVECSSSRHFRNSQLHSNVYACLFVNNCSSVDAQNSFFTTSVYGVAVSQCSYVRIYGQSFSGNSYNMATYETGYIHYT